ncbi:MAG: thioredoxin family protein [Salinibacter sp.]|uniref:thioredoxin family protein n=1 Tax=Salinibacter sp. TaxID=2065818 RepID=UPI0035D463E1
MPEFFDDRRPHDGLSYEEYRDHWRAQKEEDLSDPDPSERRMQHYLNYNWDRQASVHASYEPSDALQAAVASISEPQLWMVLTEPWCGDSAFLLPIIAEAASRGENVTLRILLRDDNLDIMDQYLTDGSRSIPKLVAFTEEGDELFTWGPRPQGAARRYEALDEEYDEKTEVIAELLEYYQDGGWQEGDEELAAAIQTAVPASSSAA